MKSKNKYLFILFFLFFFAGVFAQEDYYKQEEERIKKAEQIEVEIEKFVAKNLNNYKLTPEKITEITTELSQENEDDHHIVSKAELQEILISYKKEELRKLYFKEHPELLTYYTATEVPENLRLICINGGFENASTAWYTFWNHSYAPTDPPAQQVYRICANSPQATGMPLIPPINNFGTAAASIINSGSPGYVGNDPTLTSFGASVPTILPGGGGNSSVKLNFGKGQNSNIDVTTMSRTLLINDPLIEFNFSLILERATNHPNTNNAFFFISVLDNNGGLVDSICIQPNTTNCIFTPTPNNPNILFTGWVCARLNVARILGQQGTLRFTISDCSGGGHFGTVYIDNICGSTCSSPVFGALDINPLDPNCPVIGTPYNVCGTFSAPLNSTPTGMTISMSTNGGGYVLLPISPTFPGSGMFCFTIPQTAFGANPNGNTYQFQVNDNYLQICNINPLTTNIATASVVFNNCCLATDTFSWPFDNVFSPMQVTEERSNWITARNIIFNGARAIYHAGNYIELLPNGLFPGFEAVTGSEFSAYIDDCGMGFVYKMGNNVTEDNTEINVYEEENIHLIENNKGLVIYPNPTNGLITISDKNEKFINIKIISFDGKQVYNKKIEATSNYQLDMSGFNQGIYILFVETESGFSITKKVIKN